MKRMNLRALATSGLVGLLAAAAASSARAQGWIEPLERWPASFRVQRVRSDVRITVDADRRVAFVEVEEVFRNGAPRMLEGDYLYPIPPEAVFTDFSLFIGEEEVRGEVLAADRARRIYEEIVRRRKDPALIELVGHGLLRARVFPVEPGATRRVILRYTQLLGRDGDLMRLRYPRVVPTRPAGQRLEAAPGHAAPQHQYPFTLTITINGASRFATPYSPTHRIEVRERGPDRLEIACHGDAAGRDFELFLPLRESLVGASLVAHAPRGEDGYFMLLISPPAARAESEIPRDLTLVLDVSGSMSGGKIEQARSALDQILAGLRSGDRFRLITFNSAVRSFDDGWSAADRETLAEARDYLAGVRAGGSTNMMAALREALQARTEPDRLSLVVFLTDGKPTVGETAPERIADAASRLRDGERIFAFGVGYDVNTFLLDRMVEGGRGSVTYVQPGQDVEEAVSSLSRRISFPALSDLRIVRAPARLEDYYPDPLPDLFYGDELVLFGRYRGDGSGDLVLEGARAGRRQRFTYHVQLPRRQQGNDFIPRLWAARKAGALSAQLRLHGSDPEVIEEIRQLALRYGIITEYTSYLVEEPRLALLREPEAAVDVAAQLSTPPAEMAGAEAFKRAERSSRLGQAAVLDEAESVGGLYSGHAADAAGRSSTVRHSGRKLFVLDDGIWTDVTFDPSLRVIEVAPFSEAYFRLLEKLPALKPYFALGGRLLIAGDGVALKVSQGGATALDPGELDALERGLAANF